jgi:hypothetical protein
MRALVRSLANLILSLPLPLPLPTLQATIISMFVVLMIVDFMFGDDTSFIYEPDIKVSLGRRRATCQPGEGRPPLPRANQRTHNTTRRLAPSHTPPPPKPPSRPAELRTEGDPEVLSLPGRSP